ncbi:S8 family serine peptidase [Reichenbachiella ulvae]|uniref:S8 family serine peptidase n=1 Tax=Reichenbachiella ulvae TaxID=2980104 RepID=A0ABT3CNA3_9BACT|nr:S8 family serine peptidase [Reichenbachiella ulvae]MCV9385226.1 S8 family serine peptidase [Reichenbachiella ulvae]
MRKIVDIKLSLKLLSCLAFALIISSQIANAQNADTDLIQGKIRVKFTPESIENQSNLRVRPSSSPSHMGIEKMDELSDRIGVKNIKRVFPYSPKHEAKHRKYGLHLWYELEFDPDLDPNDIVKQYQGISDLEIIKPVYKKVNLDGNSEPVVIKKDNLRELDTQSTSADSIIFDDPLVADQWHYQNYGNVGLEGFDIDLFNAWQSQTGSSDIIVSVVDAGIDVYHEDLEANIWKNQAEINGEEGVDDDGNGYVDDYFGYNFNSDLGTIYSGSHGTHVAGTVGAVSNNGLGVAGVAGGDGSGNGVKLMSCQVFTETGSGGANFAEAIVYGADNGAVISQNSWGYNQIEYYEPEVYDAIKYFVAEAGNYEGSPMKGGVLFFAAGNTGAESRRYPGLFEEVICVSATGPTGFPSPYTTYGDWVDIAAPGGDMTNFGEEGGVLSTLPDNNYGYIEGTSMACPHVSGVAALIISKFGGEDFTADDLKRIIINSTDRLIFIHDNKYGRGYLNADKALLEDSRVPPNPISDLAAKETFHNEVRLSWTVPNDDSGEEPLNYYLAIAESAITKDNFDSNSLFLLENTAAIGEEFEINITGLIKEKDYWFAVKSTDQFENLSDISNILKTTTSKEPHFMESVRSLSLKIDASVTPVKDTTFQFSNIGEGIVYWNTLIRNEDYFRYPIEEENTTSTSVNSLTQTINYSSLPTTVENFSTSNIIETGELNIQSLEDMSLASAFNTQNRDHWKNDATQFVAGISYDNGTYPGILAGTGNENAGLIMATRYEIPYDYSFNLTHVQAVLFPETNEVPIIVEIKKGGRTNPLEAETIYTQKYYPDTTNILKYYTIPIYQPQRFSNNEFFWVVLHFPSEMTNPIACQLGQEYLPNTFYFSRSNGRNYEDFVRYYDRPLIPMIDALSTGDDGSYVFLNPTSGEIPAGTSEAITATIDVSHLTNGHHLASVGIMTNDVHKPMINIEVKVEVTGQKPVVDNDKRYSFEAYVGRENSLSLELENTGLDTLIIYDLSSTDLDLIRDFEDPIKIFSSEVGLVPFKYTPISSGLIGTNLNLSTNIGVLPFSLEIKSKTEPVINVIFDTLTVDVDYGSTAQLDVTLENNGSDSELLYDLSHYSIPETYSGKTPSKLTYNILDSNDAGGPTAGLWEDITGFGSKTTTKPFIDSVFALGMKFPFFNEQIESTWIFSHAQLNTYINASLIPIKIDGYFMSLDTLYHHNFGDRSVFTFVSRIQEFVNSKFNVYGELTYQIVLFRDGTIEFRYQDVDDLTADMKYQVLTKGIEDNDSLVYRDFDTVGRDLFSGQVIRFEPTSTISMISEASPIKGSIGPGSSKTISLTIDPENYEMPSGLYNNNFLIKDNTYEGSHSFPFQINVTGQGLIEIDDSLHFEKVKIGLPKTAHLMINNTGFGSLELSQATFSSNEFSTSVTLPITVEALSNIAIPVVFDPIKSGSVSGYLDLAFSSGETKTILLNGTGAFDAEYTFDFPGSISVNLVGGNKTTVPVTISNTTANNVPLEFIAQNSIYGSLDTPTPSKAMDKPNEELWSNFGYQWQHSDSTRQYYQWRDLKRNGQLIQIDTSAFHLLKLPFAFPFYGEKFDSIWISNEGFVTVVEPDEQTIIPLFEAGDGFKGMIAPYWANLRPSNPEEGILLDIQSDRVLIQWDNFTSISQYLEGGTVTFQLEIVQDGSIYFHYKDIINWTGLLKYGLESPDESEVLQEREGLFVANFFPFGDSTTLSIHPPLTKSLSAGETQNLDLILSAEDLYHPGSYQDSVVVTTNSEKQPKFTIPFQINVTGSPKLIADTELKWEEVVYKEDLIIRQSFEIRNEGYDVLSIESISNSSSLGTMSVYDTDGNKYIRLSSGLLSEAIEIGQWESLTLIVEIPVKSNNIIIGNFDLSGNFDTHHVNVEAKIVSPPIFDWDGMDQSFSMLQTQTKEFQFNINNTGSSTLVLDMTPAIVPPADGNSNVGTIDKIGNFTKDQPVSVDSLSIDSKEIADGIATTFIETGTYAFANKFENSEENFYLTHIKIYEVLKHQNELMTISVYYGGEKPQEGQLAFRQSFIIDQEIDEEWVYFELEEPLSIPSNQDFIIMVEQPTTIKFIGYDSTNDLDLRQKTFTGVYQKDGQYYWNSHIVYNNTNYVWKIRPLTASGEDAWLDLDIKKAKVAPGESLSITAIIDPKNTAPGKHQGKVLVASNDPDNSNSELTIDLSINGAAQFDYYPNIYEDTLRITETEEKVFSYLFSDPEGEQMTLELDSIDGTIDVEFEQTGDRTGQVKVRTDYEDAGIHHLAISLSDASGNLVRDTVVLEVINKNRPPVFNSEYEIINMNLAGTNQSLSIDPYDLFSDPDGDDIRVYAGNFTPEIVDLGFGSYFLNLTAITEGTGMLIFAADDGQEGGYVESYAYAQIINDPDAVGGETNSTQEAERILSSMNSDFICFPNPVTNRYSKIYYNLSESSNVKITLLNTMGQILIEDQLGQKEAGTYLHQLDIGGLYRGVYHCIIKTDQEKKSLKIVLQ